jgi:hypothetical protein
VRLSCGVLMESFCESIFGVDLLSMIKIYSEEESERRISWTHQSFGNVRDLDGKNLGASETLVSEVYAGCNGPRCVHTRVV